MPAASRGEIPKQCGSKSLMPATWPPQRLQIFPGLARPAAKNFARLQRSSGVSTTASRPSSRSCQKAGQSSAPPGNRQPMPTIASGSSLGVSPPVPAGEPCHPFSAEGSGAARRSLSCFMISSGVTAVRGTPRWGAAWPHATPGARHRAGRSRGRSENPWPGSSRRWPAPGSRPPPGPARGAR